MSTGPTPAPAADWRKLHAFGLPAGSVRALLALLVLGTVWAVMLLKPDKQVPYHLQNLMFIILGHYFAARGKPDPADAAGPPPLFLPRGVVRFLLIGGFVGVGILLYQQNKLLELQVNQSVMTLFLVAGFLIGVLLNGFLLWWRSRGHRPPRLFEDARALLSLVGAVVLAFMVVFEYGLIADLGPLADVYHFCARYNVQYGAAALVGFYFGSRS